MDAVTIQGTKSVETYLYVNGVKVSEDDAPFLGTSWQYILEYPESGVNGLQIAIEDAIGNKSPAITYSYISEAQNIEAIMISGSDLFTGNALTSIRNKQNIDFSPVYGIDPETGKSVIIRAFIKVA